MSILEGQSAASLPSALEVSISTANNLAGTDVFEFLNEAAAEAALVIIAALVVALLGRRFQRQAKHVGPGKQFSLQSKINAFGESSGVVERPSKLNHFGSPSAARTANVASPQPVHAYVIKTRQLLAAGDARGALQCLESASKENVCTPGHLQAAVLSAAAQDGHIDEAEAHLLAEWQCGREVGSNGFKAVVAARAKSGQVELASNLAQTAFDYGQELDSVTLGMVVHAQARTGDVVAAESTFRRLSKYMSGRPDAHSYNSMLDACGKAGNVEVAERWLALMEEEGVSPTIVSYTSLLHAYARASDMDGAEKAFKRMTEAGLQATVVSYSAMLHCFVKSGSVARAERWLEDMQAAGVAPNAVTYATMINVCAKARNSVRAEHWFEVMLADGVAPTTVCYNSVIDACAEAWQPARAEAWLHRLEDAADAGRRGGGAKRSALAVTGASYTSAARAYSVRGQFEDVERLFARMQARGIVTDSFCVTVLLTSYCKAKPPQRERAETAVRTHLRPGRLARPTSAAMQQVLGQERSRQLCAELGLRE